MRSLPKAAEGCRTPRRWRVKNGGVTRHPFSPAWPLQMLTETMFAESDGKTTVTIKWTPLDSTDEERKTFDGARTSMTQGWTGTFEQLADYLAKM